MLEKVQDVPSDNLYKFVTIGALLLGLGCCGVVQSLHLRFDEELATLKAEYKLFDDDWKSLKAGIAENDAAFVELQREFEVFFTRADGLNASHDVKAGERRRRAALLEADQHRLFERLQRCLKIAKAIQAAAIRGNAELRRLRHRSNLLVAKASVWNRRSQAAGGVSGFMLAMAVMWMMKWYRHVQRPLDIILKRECEQA